MKHHALVLALVCGVTLAAAAQIRGLHRGRSARGSSSLDPVAVGMGLTDDASDEARDGLGVDLAAYARRPLLKPGSRAGAAAQGAMRFSEVSQGAARATDGSANTFPGMSSLATSVASAAVQSAVASSPVASAALSSPVGQLATAAATNTVAGAVQKSVAPTFNAFANRDDPCKSDDPPESCPAVDKECPMSVDGKECSGKGTCDDETGSCICYRGWMGYDCSVDIMSGITVRSDCMNMTETQIATCYNMTHSGMCTAHKLVWKSLCVKTCTALQGEVCALTNRKSFCKRAPECSPLCFDFFEQTCQAQVDALADDPLSVVGMFMKGRKEGSDGLRDLKWYERNDPEGLASGEEDAPVDGAAADGGGEGQSGQGGKGGGAATMEECQQLSWEDCRGNCRWTGLSKFVGQCVLEPAIETTKITILADPSLSIPAGDLEDETPLHEGIEDVVGEGDRDVPAADAANAARFREVEDAFDRMLHKAESAGEDGRGGQERLGRDDAQHFDREDSLALPPDGFEWSEKGH